jgi:hypothetical protein
MSFPTRSPAQCRDCFGWLLMVAVLGMASVPLGLVGCAGAGMLLALPVVLVPAVLLVCFAFVRGRCPCLGGARSRGHLRPRPGLPAGAMPHRAAVGLRS